jgi:hypothetical protein
MQYALISYDLQLILALIGCPPSRSRVSHASTRRVRSWGCTGCHRLVRRDHGHGFRRRRYGPAARGPHGWAGRSHPPRVAMRGRGGGAWPGRPWGGRTTRAPPGRGVPQPRLQTSSQPRPPPRLHGLTTAGACGYHGCRRSAGPVRTRGRAKTPSGRLWRPGRPQWSTQTWAQRPHRVDCQRLATRWGPGPPSRPRSSLSPLFAGVPPASLCCTSSSSARCWSRGGPRVHPAQGSAKICGKTCQGCAGAARRRAHRVGGVGEWRGSLGPTAPPLRLPPHRPAPRDAHPPRSPLHHGDCRAAEKGTFLGGCPRIREAAL